MAQTFYLNGFNYNVVAAAGAVNGIPTTAPDYDAVCEMDLYLETALHMFRFQTDAIDVNDETAYDLKYNFQTPVGAVFVFASPFSLNVAHNPGNATMVNADAQLLDAANNQVKHDWSRYLAKKLFGNIETLDIISNEEEVRDSIATNSATALANKFSDILAYQNTNGAGSAPDKVLNASQLTDGNAQYGPSKQILEQIIANVPSRLNSITASTTLQSVPLEVNDVIAFTMTVSPAPTQLTDLIMDGDLATVIPNYTYLVKMAIVANPINPN